MSGKGALYRRHSLRAEHHFSGQLWFDLEQAPDEFIDSDVLVHFIGLHVYVVEPSPRRRYPK